MIKLIIRRGILQLVSASAAGQVLTVGVLLVLPLLLSPDEIGAIRIMQSYAALLLIFATLGYNNSVLKLGSERGRSSSEKSRLLREAIKRTVYASLVSYVFFAILLLSNLLPVHHAGLLVLFTLSVPFAAQTVIIGSFFQANRQIPMLAHVEFVSKLLWVLGALVGTLLFGLPGFVVGSVVGQIASLGYYWVKLEQPLVSPDNSPVPADFSHIARFSFLANGIHTLGKYADVFLLSLVVLDPKEIGLYALAHLMVSGGSMIVSNIQRVLLPLLSERFDDGEWFIKKVGQFQIQTFGVSLIIACLVFVCGYTLIELVYPASYMQTTLFLGILLYAFVIRSSYSILGISTMSLGKPEYNFVSASVTTPLCIAISFLALKKYGVVGLAWSQSLCAVVILIAHVIITKHAFVRSFPQLRIRVEELDPSV